MVTLNRDIIGSMVNNKLNKFDHFLGWISGALLFLLMRPYFVWPFVGLENWYAILPLSLIFLYQSRNWNLDTSYVVGFLLLVIFASFCEGQNIVGLLFAPFIVFVFTARREFLVYTYRKLLLIYTIMVGLSMVVWVLVHIGVPLPSTIIPPLNQLKDVWYRAYPFLVLYDASFTSSFCAFLDEHGAVGTMSLFFLFIERFDLKKVSSIIILLSGVLSMSLFFYVAMALYFLYSVFFAKSVGTNRYLALLIVIIGGYYVITNETTNERIVQRLAKSEDDSRMFMGDNRAHEELKWEVERMRGTKEYFFGSHDKRVQEAALGSASYQNIIVRYGLIVLISYIAFFFFYSRHYIHNKFNVLLFMMFFLVSLYNRPYIFNTVFLFLFCMGVYSYSEQLKVYFIEPNKKKSNGGE